MKQLTVLDAMFLHLETAETPMHLASVHPLRMPRGYRGDFVAEVRTHVAKRLHLAPILHRKLLLAPLDLTAPMWVEDESVDLEHHVRRVGLRRPGSMNQLRALVGRVQSAPLDRARPLWELILVEGFQGRGWVAILKVHHAGIDGQSGQVLIEALMDISPRPREVPPPRRRRRGPAIGEASAAGRIARGLAHAATQAGQLVSHAPQFLRNAANASGVMGPLVPRIPGWTKRGGHGEIGSGVPRTPFNTTLTRERVWAGRSIPLVKVRRIARVRDCTVNDVILTVCGMALRAYLLKGRALPDRSLIALMPVSTRQRGDVEMSNRVLIAPVRLHTDAADPLQQLRDICADTALIKQALVRSRGGTATDLPIIGLSWLARGLVRLLGRFNLAEVLPLMGNLVITNVMTSTVPLYLCGARLMSYLPALVLMHGQGLGIAVHTYAGSIDVGVIGCPRAAPDVEKIAILIGEAVDQLGRGASGYARKSARTIEAPR